MSCLHAWSPWEKTSAWLVATALSAALLGTTVLIFAAPAQTPWFDAGATHIARAAERCLDETASARRHACLRELARTEAANLGRVAKR